MKNLIVVLLNVMQQILNQKVKLFDSDKLKYVWWKITSVLWYVDVDVLYASNV